MQPVARSSGRPAPGWLPRTIIAGFIALGISTVGLVVASVVLGSIGELYRGSNVLTEWMYELTHNAVVERGRESIFASLGVHMAFGLIWAILYAAVFEPRLRRYAAWQAGMMFSLLPFFLSVAVFLPLTGGGMFGAALGAGPLPLLGNLILHLAYGSALGEVYGSTGDRAESAGDTEIEVVRQRMTMGRAERLAALGIVVGVFVGAIGGLLLGAAMPSAGLERLLGSWPITLAVAGALAFAAVGALVGSLAGLTDPNGTVGVDEPPTGAQPVASALIPLGAIGFVAVMIVSIGSGLLTVGDTHHFGKREGYDHAIVLGLTLLTLITFTCAMWSRGGSSRQRGH